MTLWNHEAPLALAMLQPAPLPGSYRHQGASIEQITHQMLQEAEDAAACGFDGFLLQNMNDMPVKQHSRPEAIAYLTRIGLALKRHFPDQVLGILVNWDGVAALSVADAVGADFVRVEHLYTGAEITSAGLLQAQCCDICELRKRIGTSIPIYADIYECHGVPLGAKSIGDAAWEAVHEAFADGLFVGGKSVRESIAAVQEARARVDVPIFLSGGGTGDNIRELLQYFDGVSVATWIKNGDMKNPIDPGRARRFMGEVAAARFDRTLKAGAAVS